MDTFNVQVQFCIAHLIRDVKFLMTLPDQKTRNYGKRLRDAIRGLFEVIHRRDELKPSTFARRLTAARDVVMAKATKCVPPAKKAQNMAKRFLERGEAYFEFITTPNVEPTNNIAEQAIRFVVIDRRHFYKKTGRRELAANRGVVGASGYGQRLLLVTVPAVMSSTSFIKLSWPTGKATCPHLF